MAARRILAAVLLGAMSVAHAQSPASARAPTQPAPAGTVKEGFVSRGTSVSLLVNAIAGSLDRSAVVSQQATKKRVEGSFDLTQPRQALDAVCKELGLVWYDDGQSLYVYDASETRQATGHLRYASLPALKEFLARERLDDPRYPVRGGAVDGMFYISGPPVLVQAVIDIAKALDEIHRDADETATFVEIIKIENGFVGPRPYGLRDEKTTMPGIADLLVAMLDAQPGDLALDVPAPVPESGTEGIAPPVPPAPSTRRPPARRGTGSAPRLAVVAHPQSNSLLLLGTREQLRQARELVDAMDAARQQIELSLWIIDVKKSEVDRLGVNWSGQVSINNYLGVAFNQDNALISTLDGGHFLASVSALVRNGAASVVSRPVLLTQENVEAHFDSNNTFYESLVGERVASLESVTYGTLISVLPRLSSAGEVEMQLRIEDGTAAASAGQSLPTVSRTSIDTVARVPQHLSLLVGGYTRSAQENGVESVPGLSRLPLIGGVFRNRRKTSESVVRMFLIQPRVLSASVGMTEGALRERVPAEATERLEEAGTLLSPTPARKSGEGAQ